ncbi:MAG TPA: hypothetical protein VGI19_10965 [Candidatus Cybelea sp.]|jgi:hypothetical protein
MMIRASLPEAVALLRGGCTPPSSWSCAIVLALTVMHNWPKLPEQSGRLRVVWPDPQSEVAPGTHGGAGDVER